MPERKDVPGERVVMTRWSRLNAWLATLRQDLRYAFRALRHARGFAAWVVSSLAIGMAVTIAALALLSALMFEPFPGVTEQQRLVRVTVSHSCGGRLDCWSRMASEADYAALRDGLTGLEGLAAYMPGDLAVALPDARSMRGLFASANYFDVLGVRAAIGRTFTAADGDTHAAVAVIAHSAWTRDFGADPSVIGRSIGVANDRVEIVGVAAPLFVGIDARPGARGPDVWLPIWLADRVLPAPAAGQQGRARYLNFAGRLNERVDVADVQAETEVLAQRLAATRGHGSLKTRGEARRVWRTNPDNWHLGILILLPIPILVLVIACVNAANLMLARGSERQREIAIRLAIGAGRRRVVRQLLVESGVLALLATAVAVPIAWSGLQLASNPLNMPIPMNGIVLALAVLTAGITTVAFGLAPAVRIAAQQPSIALGPVGARSDAAPRQSRLRRGLVVAQVALSLALMATAGQLVATMRFQGGSAGTPGDRLLVARFDLEPLKLPAAEVESFYRRLLDGTSRLPGVEAAGLARHSAVWTFGRGAGPASIDVWGPGDGPGQGRVVIGGYAGGELLPAVGLRVLHGRGFSDADRGRQPLVAVVNQTFADQVAGVAVGSVLRVAPRGSDYAAARLVRVVGIIEPALEPRFTPDGRPVPKVYLPSPLEPEPALALYVRTVAPAAALAQPVRDLVTRFGPRVPIMELGSLDELNERSFGTQFWLARVASFLGVVGLLLATAGLYGVSSYVVAMRAREIAIRMAVGARPRRILSMVLGQSMRVALIGLAAGGAAAVVATRLIQAEFHGIHGLDHASFGGAIALFLAAMLVASAIPAARAARVDPVRNLKDG